MSADARTLKSFASLAGGEAIARGLGFAAALIVARRLGPAMYGIIGVASGIMLYLNQVADGGIELSGVSAVARQPHGLTDLISSTLTIRVLVALGLTIIVVAVGLTWFPQPDGVVLALYALGLVFVAAGARWVFVGLQRTNWVAGARITGELTALLLVVLTVHDVGDVAFVPLATLLSGAIVALVMMVGLRALAIRPALRIDWAVSQPLFTRGPHLVGFTLLGLVLFNADLIYLRFVAGEGSAGYYAAAYTFIAFAANLSVTWSFSVLPVLTRYEPLDPQRAKVYETSMLLAYAVALPVAVGGMLTAAPLVRLVFGAEYLPAVPALVWLLPAVPLTALREVAVVALIGTSGGERRLIRINAVCAIFNVAILIPVVPAYGLIGAAVVTILTEILRLFLAFRFATQAGFPVAALVRFGKPALAAGAMVPVLMIAGDRSFLLLAALGAAVYAAVLLATGVLRIGRPFEVRLVV